MMKTPCDRSAHIYVIAHDRSPAPNNQGGMTTLVVCKPVIRKSAKVGDLVIGCLGLKPAQDSGFEHRSIRFCAEVANTMTLQEYARKFPNRADNIFQADTMEINDNGRELSGDTTTGFADRVNKADRALIFKDVHWLEGRNVSIEPLLFGKNLGQGQIKNSRNEEFEKAYVACIGPDRDEHEPTSEVAMSDSSSDGETEAMDAEGEDETEESHAHSGPADGAVGESPAEESPTGPPHHQRSEVADDAAMTAEEVAASGASDEGDPPGHEAMGRCRSVLAGSCRWHSEA
jgi:hypothetical protein